MKRAQQFSQAFVIGAVIAIIILLVAAYMIWNSGTITMSVTRCEPTSRQCFTSTCGDEDYADRYYLGDPYCEKEELGDICCSYTGEPVPAVERNTRVFTDESAGALKNGATVEMRLTDTGAEREFELSFDRDMVNYRCYGQVRAPGEDTLYVQVKDLYETVPGSSDSVFDRSTTKVSQDTATPPNYLPACDDKDLKNPQVLWLSHEAVLASFGKDISYSIIVIDPKTCAEEEDVPIRRCDPLYTHTINVRVPSRNPEIAFKEGERVWNRYETNVLTPGNHRMQAVITEPMTKCTIQAEFPFVANPQQYMSNFLNQFTLGGSMTDDCYETESKTYIMNVNLDEQMVRGIPFDVKIDTYVEGNQESRVSETFRFQIQEHPELRVIGPAPGLSREKNVDIVCKDIVCGPDIELALVSNPLDCSPLSSIKPTWNSYKSDTIEGSNRFRVQITEEKQSGKYVCVKEDKKGTPIYAPGLWAGVPQPITIDNTSPTIDVKFDSFSSVLKFTCVDNPSTVDGDTTGKYKSGCKKQPFSYAYINDPLRFAAHIIPFGSTFGLGDTFGGCPNPDDESQWVRFTDPENTMDYISRDVRVICMRATDNAGNHAVQSKLLFNSMQAIGLLLETLPDSVVPSVTP